MGCEGVAGPAMRDAMAQSQRQRQQQCDRQKNNENRPPVQAESTLSNHGSVFPALACSTSRQRSREGPGYLALSATMRDAASQAVRSITR